MNEIKVFSPATVSNVACGFDVLGFPLESIGDETLIRKTSKKGVKITKNSGYSVPLENDRNVATVAANNIINNLNPDCGFEIEIHKNIKPGSGIGSSGSSAAASVYGINKLLGEPFNKEELIKFAMKGEVVSSISEHADNVAPAILGGLVMVKSISPLRVFNLPTPNELWCFIINPKIEVKTSYSRELLPKDVPLKSATSQLANFGGLVHGLHTDNYELIKSSLVDNLVETHRKKLIPLFDEVKKKCLDMGALGCSISGSGPSIFALTRGEKLAKDIEKSVSELYSGSGTDFSTYVSKISDKGVSVIEEEK